MKKNEERENLSVWVDSQRHEEPAKGITGSRKTKPCEAGCGTRIEGAGAGSGHSNKHPLKALLVEVLSGRKVRILDTDLFQKNKESEGYVRNQDGARG